MEKHHQLQLSHAGLLGYVWLLWHRDHGVPWSSSSHTHTQPYFNFHSPKSPSSSAVVAFLHKLAQPVLLRAPDGLVWFQLVEEEVYCLVLLLTDVLQWV